MELFDSNKEKNIKNSNKNINKSSEYSSDSTIFTFSRDVEKSEENTESCGDLETGKSTDKSESSQLVEGSKEADNSYRNFGKTYPMWFNGYEPRIVIGPHCKLSYIFYLTLLGPFYICLIITIMVFTYIFSCMLIVGFFEKFFGILLLVIQLGSYTVTFLINPGIPKLENFYMIGKSRIEIKKCRECRNYIRMDIKTNHCYECGVCVEGHDHHCPWTSKCIGKNNLPFFYIFVISTLGLFLYFIVMISLFGVRNDVASNIIRKTISNI